MAEQEPSGLGFQLKKMQEAFDEVERRLKLAHPKALRWDKLRNWLTSLVDDSQQFNSVLLNVGEKKGVRIALNIMDRIEEDDKK